MALSDLALVLTVKLFIVTDFLPDLIFRPPPWVMVPGAGRGFDFAAGDGKVALEPLILAGLTAVILMPAFFRLFTTLDLRVRVVVPLEIGLGVAAVAIGTMTSIAISAAATIATGSILPLALPSRVDSDMYFLHCVCRPLLSP